jgi:hypothetical protein
MKSGQAAIKSNLPASPKQGRVCRNGALEATGEKTCLSQMSENGSDAAVVNNNS